MFYVQRLLSVLLILAAIALAALWIVGGKKTENQTSLEFDATPDQVFPFLTEPDRIREWFSGLVSIDPIEAPSDEFDGPDAPPIRRVLQNADGERTNYEDQILRFTRNQMLSIKSRNDDGSITWVYQLEPKDGNKTKVILRVVKSASGLGRLMAPLKEDVSLKQIEVDIRQLKEVVENSIAQSNLPPTIGDAANDFQ